jgi:2-polyprenyl-3-methyl-5-hydroxy-6-metoxy-1,4-benzoquinol methylase
VSGVSERRAQAALDARARRSCGDSSDVIRALAVRVLDSRGARGVIVDVGCGSGRLRAALGDRAARYVGVDAVRYDGFPTGAQLLTVDLDREPIVLPDAAADAVVALETVEHLENPRRLMRELVRIVRPGGVVIVSTPNQRSLLSLMTLVTKGRFNEFQDVDYPAHRTALLDVDLARIAAECGLSDIEIRFTQRGRVPLSAWHYPAWLSTRFPRALSDNVLMAAQRHPEGPAWR